MTLTRRRPKAPPLRTGITDAGLIWAFYAVVAIEVLVTYTRTPVGELYHAYTGGVSGGAGRLLAFVGFPTGLAALAVLPIVLDRAPRRHLLAGAAAAVVLSVATFWPGALDESGLDAPPARILAAIGVILVALLTISARRASGAGTLGGEPGDRLRLVAGVALLALALPWMAADLGLALDRVPVVGSLFLTDVAATQPSRPGLHQAVHDGHHHGMDGVLLAWTALLSSRTISHLRHRAGRFVLSTYASFLLAYGTANAVQDGWNEQIVKRGWTNHELPMMLVPSASLGWLAIVLATAAGALATLRLTIPQSGLPRPAR